MYFSGEGSLGGLDTPGAGLNQAWIGMNAVLQLGGTGASNSGGGLALNQFVNNSGTLALNYHDNNSLNIVNPISGTGALVSGLRNTGLPGFNYTSASGNEGAGSATLSGVNAYTGPTVLNSGTLCVSASAAPVSESNVVALGFLLPNDISTTSAAKTFTVPNAAVAGMIQAGMILQAPGVPGFDMVTGMNTTTLTGTLVAAATATATVSGTLGQNGSLGMVWVPNANGLAVGETLTSGSGFNNGATMIYAITPVANNTTMWNTGTNGGFVVTLGTASESGIWPLPLGSSAEVASTSATTCNVTPTGTSYTFAGYSSLPAATTIQFNGGAFQWGAGNNQDYSSQFSTASNSLNYLLDTNGNNVHLSYVFPNTTGTLTKLLTGGAGSASYPTSAAQSLASGTLTLNANSTFAQTNVNGGELDIASGATLTSPVLVQAATVLGGNGTVNGAVTVLGGTLGSKNGSLAIASLNGSTSSTISGAVGQIPSNSIISATSTSVNSSITAGEFDVNGTLNLQNTVALNVASGATLGGGGTLSGSLTLGGGATLKSTNTLTVSNGIGVSGVGNILSSGTIAGAATLNANGALVVQGCLNGNVNVQQSGAVLSGNGSIGAPGATINLTLGNGGTLRPNDGASATSAGSGTMTINGTLTLKSSGTITLDLDSVGVAFSAVQVNGSLLDSIGQATGGGFTLKLEPGSGWTGTPASGQTWLNVIATNSSLPAGILGDINTIDCSDLSLANNSIQLQFDTVHNDNLDLVYNVPEPSTGAAILAGVGMLGLSRRLRRRKR